MRTQFYSIDPRDTVFAAAQQLLLRNVESLLVVADDGRLRGIVTERDVLLAVLPRTADVMGDETHLAGFRDLSEMATERFRETVAEVMHPSVETVTPSAPLTHALGRMLSRRLRRLAVVDPESREVVGVVSQRDALSALVIGQPALIRQARGRVHA